MEIAYILISLVIGGLIAGAVVWFLLKQKPEAPNNDLSPLLLLQNQINDLITRVDEKMGSSNRDMQEAVRHQFSESQKLIKDITEKVTKVEESSRQVFTVAEGLRNLEKILKHQKQRGNLGEAGLELILSNILSPTQFKMQY